MRNPVKYLISFIALVASVAISNAQDAPKPDTPPESAARAAAWGEPVTITLPQNVKDAIRDQGVAITRMSLLFDERGSKDGIALEYEGMRSEVPAVFAAFVADKCDQHLSYKDWQLRAGRAVDVTFLVKTMPANLDGLEVSIEHLHYKGNEEVLQSTYNAGKVELGKPHTVRLRGARPGVNRYRLVVSYKKDSGEKVSEPGFSHWLTVAAPPMFEFACEPQGTATWRKAGKLTVVDAQVSLNAAFMLHGGLAVTDCELRVMRKGARQIRLSELPADVRRVVGEDAQAAGWQEVGRARVGDKRGWLVAEMGDDGFVKLSCVHALSVTSDVLPLNEAWEYRFELRHSAMREPLATWTSSIGLKIAKAEDVSRSVLLVTASNLPKPLEIALREKK